MAKRLITHLRNMSHLDESVEIVVASEAELDTHTLD